MVIGSWDRSFSNLTTLYLCYRERDERLWLLEDWECLLSRSIRFLTLESALVENTSPLKESACDFLDEYFRSTPLEVLYLEDCMINTVALKHVLSVPKALKVFKANKTLIDPIIDDVADTASIPGREALTKWPWLDAMAQQAHSLEEIDIDELSRGSEQKADCVNNNNEKGHSEFGRRSDDEENLHEESAFDGSNFLAFERLKPLRINGEEFVPEYFAKNG
ncbi:MAG: hypothetical protein Q9160_006583 [Pyrenula sp. 1 TL-2023]